MRELDIAETGETDEYSPDDILADWQDLDLQTDAWVVRAPDGLLCGYATLTKGGTGRMVADAYCHPSHYGCDIGTTLIEVIVPLATYVTAVAQAGNGPDL